MNIIAEEPDKMMGHDHPGTIKKIFENGDKQHFIKISDNSPHKISEHFIEITSHDVQKILLNWKTGKRVSIVKLRGKVVYNILKPEDGYAILPNLELFIDRSRLDITI